MSTKKIVACRAARNRGSSLYSGSMDIGGRPLRTSRLLVAWPLLQRMLSAWLPIQLQCVPALAVARPRLILLAAACSLLLGHGTASTASSAEALVPSDEKLVAVLSGGTPSSVDELRAMQEHIRHLTEVVLPASVGVEVGTAQGSGVIVTETGYILTAAHVIGKPNQDARIFLHDGRTVRATTLGSFRTVDAGLLKINASELPRDGKWPFVPVGDSSKLVLGQWCVAMGHPGGMQASQRPALRLGRIHRLELAEDGGRLPSVHTDCTLIGGDSGGPLFDLQGRVIGIHSRIAEPLTANLHVPINVYRESWTRLARGDSWGYQEGRRPFIGVQGEAGAADAAIAEVFPNSPAAKAGLRAGDVILSFADSPVSDFASLQKLVEQQDPGARVRVVVRRGAKDIDLMLVIGRKAS